MFTYMPLCNKARQYGNHDVDLSVQVNLARVIALSLHCHCTVTVSGGVMTITLLPLNS